MSDREPNPNLTHNDMAALAAERLDQALAAQPHEISDETKTALLDLGASIDYNRGEGDAKDTLSASDFEYLLTESPEEITELRETIAQLSGEGYFDGAPSPSFMLGYAKAFLAHRADMVEYLDAFSDVLDDMRRDAGLISRDPPA